MYLLDTNILSELRKRSRKKADLHVVAWADQVKPRECYISAITMLEIEIGIKRIERRDKEQAAILWDWYQQTHRDFKSRILAFTHETASICSGLHIPDPKPERDMMIAATAIEHKLVLATRNIKDFADTSVKTINPWGSVAKNLIAETPLQQMAVELPALDPDRSYQIRDIGKAQAYLRHYRYRSYEPLLVSSLCCGAMARVIRVMIIRLAGHDYEQAIQLAEDHDLNGLNLMNHAYDAYEVGLLTDEQLKIIREERESNHI